MDKTEGTLIGEHPSIQKIRELIDLVADTGYEVFLIGETGVGKTLVATLLHRRSPQKEKPLQIIECALTPSVFLNSALFGHEKGAFPEADKMQKGAFELCDGGTVVLKSIHAMPIHIQQKMLECLHDSFFRRLGGDKKIEFNCRIIATSTAAEIEKNVMDSLFFELLYYKLNIIKIDIPPLRERGEDIALLFKYFMHQYCSEIKRSPVRIDDVKEIDFLLRYHWPGNVRELANTVRRLIVLRDWGKVENELLEEMRSPVQTDKSEARSSLLVKFIEFPPELYQSGMSILSYFGTFLRKQYPDKRIKVRIEQEELKVRMVVETPEGELESVEKSLSDYGKIWKGEIVLDDFFDNRADALELKQQLSIARVQLDTQKELLALKDGEIRRTSERIDFLETQFGKLSDIVDKNLGYSALAVTNFSDLLERVSKLNNALITEAVQILKDKAERGILESDERYVKQALKTIKDQDTSVFQQVVDVLLRGGVSSATGNLIYSWVMAISAALPK